MPGQRAGVCAGGRLQVPARECGCSGTGSGACALRLLRTGRLRERGGCYWGFWGVGGLQLRLWLQVLRTVTGFGGLN